MKRSRFSEEQIIAVLREQEAGVPTADVCRKHGISTATFCAWKAKFGGMDVSEAKRLRSLEDENAKLKRLLADAMLDNVALKDLLSKNGDARRQAGSCRPSHGDLRVERGARACQVIRADRKRVRYRSCRPADADLRRRLRELAGEQRRFGYRRLHVLLRHEGHGLNRKKTQRLYREEGLSVR